MRRYLFTFEPGRIPPAVILATVVLFGIFAIGIAYQLLAAAIL